MKNIEVVTKNNDKKTLKTSTTNSSLRHSVNVVGPSVISRLNTNSLLNEELKIFRKAKINAGMKLSDIANRKDIVDPLLKNTSKLKTNLQFNKFNVNNLNFSNCFSRTLTSSTFKNTQKTSNNNSTTEDYNMIVPKSNENISIYIPSAKSVAEYSYKEERNAEHRESMEDFYNIIDGFMGDNNKGFFSIYDGHGGSDIVKYIKDRLPELFGQYLEDTDHNVEESFISSFHTIDEELQKKFTDTQAIGSTATVVYINKNRDGKKVLYCANVGDSKSVLITQSECKTISADHKCTDANEVIRIKQSGGAIFNGRVFGQLALTRALGDHAMKKYGVISTPSISMQELSEGDLFILLCSDGVWDVISEDEMFSLSNEFFKGTSYEFASAVINQAIERDSKDNISCIVIKI